MAATARDRGTGPSVGLVGHSLPSSEVAARAGHSVDVLLKVYAKCIDGQEARVNQRIEEALDDDSDG